MKTQESGRIAEDEAMDYMIKQGVKLVARNYNCRFGEIDLIMRDKECLVFVEVRNRKNTSFGGGIASITLAKREKIMKTASHYLICNKLYDKIPFRFDVVSIDGAKRVITWLKNAFGADY